MSKSIHRKVSDVTHHMRSSSEFKSFLLLQHVCSTRGVEHANFITRPRKITQLLNFVDVIQSGARQRVNVECQVNFVPSCTVTGWLLVCCSFLVHAICEVILRNFI